MSIRPQHVENILDGAKTIELRKRGVSFSEGTRIWIYCTLPIGAIQVAAIVENIEINDPQTIWDKYENDLCIDKNEFLGYVEGATSVSAIHLTSVAELKAPISLENMRVGFGCINPPQSYSYIHDTLLLEKLLNIPQKSCHK